VSEGVIKWAARALGIHNPPETPNAELVRRYRALRKLDVDATLAELEEMCQNETKGEWW